MANLVAGRINEAVRTATVIAASMTVLAVLLLIPILVIEPKYIAFAFVVFGMAGDQAIHQFLSLVLGGLISIFGIGFLYGLLIAFFGTYEKPRSITGKPLTPKNTNPKNPSPKKTIVNVSATLTQPIVLHGEYRSLPAWF